jgi:putative ATP-dependent endonuclease of the OLD family
MKLCELDIKNYGCIGQQGVQVKIDNIVVLLGSNNVGKTTVLNAYELFTESGKSQPLSSFHNNSTDNPIEICGIFSDLNEHDIGQIGTKWIFQHEEYGESIKYKWVWNRADFSGEKFSWNNEDSTWVSGGMGGWDSKIASCIPIPLRINPFDKSSEMETKIIEILTSAVKESVKSDSGRLDGMIQRLNTLANEVKDEIAASLSETTTRVAANLIDIFPNYAVDIQPEAGKFEPEKIIAAGTHVMITKGEGQAYPLSNQGSGLQRAFLWSAIEALSNSGALKKGKKAVTNSEPRILLVEEPESFLHPPAIRAARESLYRISELGNWQVMITTHSPVFIDVSKPHTTIVRVDYNEQTGTRTFSTDKANFSDDERERLQMVRACNPSVNEFFFSDNVVLVEGETEHAVFNTLNHNNSSTTIVNCYGKANIPMFQKILNHFNIRYTAIHDLDSPKCKRKDSLINNSMWTINGRILAESIRHEGNKVIVNVPDFEGQYFGYLQNGDKPYNAIKEINKPEFIASTKYTELVSIANGENTQTIPRIITNVEQYSEKALAYLQTITDVNELVKWNFD